MKVFKPALVIWIIALALLFSFSSDVLFAQPTSFDIPYKTKGKVGDPFKEGYKECVDFVKKSRPALDNIPYKYAKNMKDIAEGNGFEVNNVPRVGSVLVLDEVVSYGVKTGHVAIVVKVKQDPNTNNPDKYILTIRDANVAGRSEGLKSIIDERDIEFYKNEMRCIDPLLKKQHIAGFIHEEKTVYEEKKEQAAEYVNKVFKEKAGRNPSVEELNMYTTMMFAGENQSEEKLQNYIQSSLQTNLNAKLNPQGFLAKLKDLSSLDVWNATFGIPIALAPTTSYGASDSWDDAVTVAQGQTTEGVDNNPTFTSGGNYWGHIALMLTKSGTLEDVYSTLGPTDLASSNISLPSYRSSRAMTMNGTSSPPQITALETSTGAVTVGIPVSIDMHELGNNSYGSWGYWLQNNIMQAGGTNYSVDNRGYYLTGDPTTNAQMSNLMAHNDSGTYTGTADGTYWTNTGGTNMSGTFNANISFASRSLSNINISISGGGHSASISGATATSSGSSSTFIGNSDGQWKIDGATLGSSSSKDLRGVVLGPTGKAVEGGFGMGQTVDTTGVVIGIFQGTR